MIELNIKDVQFYTTVEIEFFNKKTLYKIRAKHNKGSDQILISDSNYLIPPLFIKTIKTELNSEDLKNFLLDRMITEEGIKFQKDLFGKKYMIEKKR